MYLFIQEMNMPNKKAKQRKHEKKQRIKAIKEWKRKQKLLKKERNDILSKSRRN